jgi:hypothetical protein
MDKTTKQVARQAKQLQAKVRKCNVKLAKLEALVDIDAAHMSGPRWAKRLARIDKAMQELNLATCDAYDLAASLHTTL